MNGEASCSTYLAVTDANSPIRSPFPDLITILSAVTAPSMTIGPLAQLPKAEIQLFNDTASGAERRSACGNA